MVIMIDAENSIVAMSEDGSRPPDVAQATLASYFGWHKICLNTSVTAAKDPRSKRLRELIMGYRVNVVGIDGDRVRIDNPVNGWCSIKSFSWRFDFIGRKIKIDAWYRVCCNTIVRKGMELSSERLRILPVGSRVYVHEQVGRRARICQPVNGWCSMQSLNGDEILKRVDTGASISKEHTEINKIPLIPEMFLVEDVSWLLSESSVLYHYQDVFREILDFAFYRLKVSIINADKTWILLAHATNSPNEIFTFLKAGTERNARMFVPSRWVQKTLKFIFPDNHNMNALVEASRVLRFWWKKKLHEIQCSQEDHFEISFEKHPESDDFPIKEGTGLNLGMTVAGHDKFGKWYHGQILSIVDGAEGMCRGDEAAFQHEIWDDVKIDEKYFYVTWIGFTKTWNEWMSSERVYKDNDLLTIAQGIKNKRKISYKWFPELEKRSAPSYYGSSRECNASTSGSGGYRYRVIETYEHMREDGRESALGV